MMGALIIPLIIAISAWLPRAHSAYVGTALTFSITLDRDRTAITIRYPREGTSHRICVHTERQQRPELVTTCWNPRGPQEHIRLADTTLSVAGELHHENEEGRMSVLTTPPIRIR